MTRRILVTGGGTGIGLACARHLAGTDTSVVLVGRRREVLERARAELAEAVPEADVEVADADLADPDAVQALAAHLRDGPTFDVLVLNAGGNVGVGAGADLESVAQGWRADFEANVLTAVLPTHALRDHLTRPGARIVAISSIAGLRGSGSYGGAKAALNAWVWSTATDLAPDGITVNAVAPGFVPETDFWQPRLRADPGLWESRIAPIPAGRPGTAEEIAEAVGYLASPGAGWTTGQILQVNGGTLLGRG